MTMTTRTDVHRPVAFDPEGYEYVFAFDNAAPGGLIGVDMEWWGGLMRDLQRAPLGEARGTHQCHHCGARIRYVALMRYLATGEIIAVGETCLDNRFSLTCKADFDRLRKAAALDRQAQRIKTAARAYIENATGVLKVALDRETNLTEAFGIEEGSYAFRTITDITRKVWNNYGEPTRGQENLVVKLIEENAQRVERAALIAAERSNETEVPAPQGRVEFAGVVLKRVWKESDFGGAFKLTIKMKDANGNVWLAWVSEPSKASCERGDVVQMKATLTQSPDKPHFAFGKRPSNFRVVGHEELGGPDALAD